jgi:hypothetical protein
MGLLLTPAPDMQSRIRSGLLDRGLAPHVADAFIMNFQDESGLNPGINEIAPLVPGSRGGFGLYQLTGPRRVAYEQFAQERGVNPADVDAQLDFMMMELQGPESRAAQSIFNAPDTGSAAAAIVTDFLRPAEEHRNKRVARYTGGKQTVSTNSPQGLLTAPQQEAAPMEREQVGGLLGRLFPNMDVDRADRIRMGINGMLHNPNQGVAQATQGRMDDRREARKTQAAAATAQQQANRTAQWLAQQPGGQKYAEAIAAGALPAGEALTMWRAASQGQEPTALMQNVEYIRQQNPGMSMQEALQMAKNGTTVNVNSGSEVGTIPPGYELFNDPDTGARRLRPIVGGPVDTEQRQAAEAQERATQAQDSQQQTTDNVVLNQVGAIREMLENGGMFDLPEAGILGNALGRMGINQEAVNMRNRLATLEGMVSFDQLAKMREASPTGGALGAISERELTLLSAQLGTLDQSSDPQTIMETLDLLESVMRKADAYPNAGQFGFGGTSQAAPKVKTYNPQTGRLE